MSVEATGQEGQASLWLLVAAKLSDFAGNLCVGSVLGFTGAQLGARMFAEILLVQG